MVRKLHLFLDKFVFFWQHLRKLRFSINPWRIEFAAIQTKSLRVTLADSLTLRYRRSCRRVSLLQGCLTAYVAIRKIKGLKPAKAGFVCVAATYSRQVQDVTKETRFIPKINCLATIYSRKNRVSRTWCISLEIILLVVLGLIFSLGIRMLPADSRLTPSPAHSPQSLPNPTPNADHLKSFSLSSPVSRGRGAVNDGVEFSPEKLMEQGKALYQAGQFTQAAQSLRQAARVYESNADTLNQALALNYLSLAEQKLGQWNQATQAIATSFNLLTQVKLDTKEAKHILALAYNTQGSLDLAQGQAQAAMKSWEKAANTYTQINDEAGRIGSLINQTTALQTLGLYYRTMKIFEQSKQSLQSETDSPLKAAGLRSLGNALLASGDIEQSQKVLAQSLVVAQQLQSPQEESATLLSLGNAAFANGNRSLLKNSREENSSLLRCRYDSLEDNTRNYYNNAIAFYDKSASKSTSTIATLQARLNRLRVLQQLEQQPKDEELRSIRSALATLTPSRSGIYARVNFTQSLVCLSQGQEEINSPSNQSKIQNLKLRSRSRSVSKRSVSEGLSIARVARQPKIQNHHDEIVQLLNTAIQQAKDIKDQRAESYAEGNLGQLYEQTKQWSIAQKHTESALNLAQIINAPDIAYQWQWQLGRLLMAQGDLERTIVAYSTAVETLQSLRGDLVALNADIQFDFRDEVEPVYRQLVALLLNPGKAKQEVTQKNLKKARDVIEALQTAELDNFFRDACTIVQPTRIDELVDNVNPPTAVIYPIILADRLEVIVKLPRRSELRHYTTDKAKNEVESTLDTLRQKLQQRYSFRDREVLSQEVYNWIIKPAEKDLEQSQVKNLVFVLDNSLRNIPMAALYDGKHYLVEKYSVALSPSLQLLEPKTEQKRFAALAGGLTESRFGFSPLPYVATELQEIKSILRSKELINQTFTDSNIENQVRSVSFPIVHLATHGTFSSQAEETFILAWNGKINVKQLREVLQTRVQVVRKSSRVPAPIELLVLSACETATGDKRAALGLAGIALRSGARSTIASLWQVDDRSTALIMSEFYRQLTNNPTITKAEALHLAQKSILQQYKEHPFYWASFVLVGNWL